jgi:hypothetical protein
MLLSEPPIAIDLHTAAKQRATTGTQHTHDKFEVHVLLFRMTYVRQPLSHGHGSFIIGLLARDFHMLLSLIGLVITVCILLYFYWQLGHSSQLSLV